MIDVLRGKPFVCCGIVLPAGVRHCAYCRTTIRLIRGRLCVLCMAPVGDDTLRDEGRCAECRSRNVKVSRETAHLLRLAAKARQYARARAA